MKRLLLLYTFIASIVAVQAQSVDVTKVTADTKTYLFNDGKNTVKNYIYDRLQAQSSCCGSDRIYLEVKVDPSGYVISAKALTGKNDCFKESVVDIVKNIKWDAADFKGPKSIFFEVKPDLPCEGRKNEYAKLPTFNNPMINPETGLPMPYAANNVVPTPPATQPAPQPVATTPTPAPQPVATTPTPAPQPVATTPTPAPQPVAVQPVAQPVAQPAAPVVVNSQPNVTVTPGTVPSLGNNPVASDPVTPAPTKGSPTPTKAAPTPMPVPPSPMRAGPTPVDVEKARETAEEVAALRAEMDKRMKDEENKRMGAESKDNKEIAAADKLAGDKKPGEKDDKGDWTIDEKGAQKTKKECKPVLNKDGKPLVDKNGKPVLECKTVVIDDKAAEPKEEKLTPEQIAAKKKADDEAKKKAEEDAKLAKMSPEEKKRFEEDNRRKAEEAKLLEVEKAAANRVADAEKKLRDGESAQRKIQDDLKRQETEIKRAQEDLDRAKTEAQRQKDEAEVARIEAEKRALADKTKEQERLMQEKMRDMQKMQQDMERLTGDLQKQQDDLRKADEKLALTKENIKQRASGGVVINTDMPTTLTKPSEMKKADKVEVMSGDTATVNKLMMQIDLLRQQIYRMQQEMDGSRSMNSTLRPSAPTTSNAPIYNSPTTAASNGDWAKMQPQSMPVPAAPGLSANGPRNTVEAQSAAANRAWESVDYMNTESLSKTEQGRTVIMSDLNAGKNLDSKAQRTGERAVAPAATPAPKATAPAPKVTAPAPKNTPVPAPVPAPQAKVQVTSAPVAPVPATVTPTDPQYVSTGDKNPDASHTGTFTNVPVAANAQLEFIDGDAGMKNYLRDKLKAQGVCGIAHVFAEVNVDRNGNVTSYKILKSTPEDLVAKVPSVILGMKFKTNPQTAPYTQTTYIEFKGDIRCEGKATKGSIKNEEDFLKTEKK